MAFRKLIALALSAGMLAGMVSMAHADDDDDLDDLRRAVERREILPLDQLRQMLRAKYPGKIIDMELDRDDGRYIYEFKVLQANGRLLEIEMDAANGRIVDVDDDD